MLKIGWIDFLNTLPFNFEIAGIKPEFDYKLYKGVPVKLNKLLRNKEIDIAIASSAEYIENFQDYLILPNLSISATNKVHSVAIFSNKQLSDIKEVYLSKASKTSRYLTKIIFDIFLKKEISYKELENYQDIEKKSVLLIGDNAIFFSDRFKYVYDLSEIWYKNTGLPFVFALWILNKEIFYKKERQLRQFYNILMESKEKILKNLPNFVKNFVKTEKFSREFATEYIKNLDYNLTEKHIQSLKLFSKYLQDVKIIKKEPKFNLLNF